MPNIDDLQWEKQFTHPNIYQQMKKNTQRKFLAFASLPLFIVLALFIFIIYLPAKYLFTRNFFLECGEFGFFQKWTLLIDKYIVNY